MHKAAPDDVKGRDEMTQHPVEIRLPNLWAMPNAELSLFAASLAQAGKAILDSGAGALLTLDCIGRMLDALHDEASRRGISFADPPFQRIRLEVAPEESEKPSVN
jgi:hypothetical protein